MFPKVGIRWLPSFVIISVVFVYTSLVNIYFRQVYVTEIFFIMLA